MTSPLVAAHLDPRPAPRTLSRMSSLPAMVDLRWEQSGDLLLSWNEAPGARNKRISRADLEQLRRQADAVGFAESREQSQAIIETRTALSSTLYELLDGPERALGCRIARAEAERRRIDLVVRACCEDRRSLATHPATWMRWELLPFAETRRRGTPPLTVVLQLGPQDLAPPRVLDAGGLRILFMAFSPQDAPDLDFEREEEELLTALAPMLGRRRASMRVVEEGTLDDLTATLLLDAFDIVHLTGHGVITPEGPRLAMEDAFGATRLVAPPELLEALERAKVMPELVMVSCCHSANVRGSVASFAAALVAGGVPNVVGWTRPVRDDLATLAATSLYEQLGAGKTPVQATHLAREHMRRAEERAIAPHHAWGTLHLLSNSAAGFRIGDEAEPLSERFGRDEVYRFLGSRMRVLKTGFVGRRRLVQRLLRTLLRGQDGHPGGARDVAGACVFGMKGVGKSCAVGRVVERAKQHASELGVVVMHGAISERSVLEAFREAVTSHGSDEIAERLLSLAGEPVLWRVRRVMEHWRGRHVAIVLDDFEQNLEPRSDGPWLVAPEAAALLEALLPTCATGKPKVLITSTAEFRVPGNEEQAIAFVPLGSFNAAAVRKLWMRGQASNELSSVSLKSWQVLADRLGRNARILTWARALLAGKTDDELAAVAARAAATLPLWAPGDAENEEKPAELSRLFLQHMAYEQARAAFGDDLLAFIKRARVFEAVVPRVAFTALAEGLSVNLDRDLGTLASWGLLEVGELDGARAYRVSPLVEPELDVVNAAYWHAAAADAWMALAAKASNGTAQLERVQAAWEHALHARSIERAEPLARRIDNALHYAGLYEESHKLAERHLEALPDSPFGHYWAGVAELVARGPHPRTAERLRRSVALSSSAAGTDEHPDVAAALHGLGGALEALGDLDGARKELERSIAISVKVRGTEEHHAVASALHELARVRKAQGNLSGALEAAERALAIHVKILGTDEHLDVAASLHTVGGVLEALGDLGGARQALERSLAIKIAVLDTEEHPDVASSLFALGNLRMAEGDFVGARRAFERSIAIHTELFDTNEHPFVVASVHALGCVLEAQGDLADARQAFQHSLSIYIKLFGTDHRDVATSLHALGRVLLAQGDLAEAREAIGGSLSILARVHGTEMHPNVAISLHDLARVLEAQGDFTGAVSTFERSLAIKDVCYRTRDHHMSAVTEVCLALLLFRLGRAEEARALSRHALQVLEEQVPGHPILQRSYLLALAKGEVPSEEGQADHDCPCGSAKSFQSCHGASDDA